MKFRKAMPIGIDTEKRVSRNKSPQVSHMRVSIPKEIRDRIDLVKGDFIEWEVDTEKKTLTAKLLK